MSTITPLAPSFQKNIPRVRHVEPEIEEPQYSTAQQQQMYYPPQPQQPQQMILTQQHPGQTQEVGKPDESQNKVVYIIVGIILILIIVIFIWVYLSKDKSEEENVVVEAKQQQIKEENAKMMAQKNMQSEMQRREAEIKRRKEVEEHNKNIEMQRRVQMEKLAELEKAKAALKQSNENLAKQNAAPVLSDEAKLQEQILKQMQENNAHQQAQPQVPAKPAESSVSKTVETETGLKIEDVTEETSTAVSDPALSQSFEDMGVVEKPKPKSKTKK